MTTSAHRRHSASRRRDAEALRLFRRLPLRWYGASPVRQRRPVYRHGKYRPSRGQCFPDPAPASQYDPGDAGYHRHIRINDIGGIKTPAETNLKDHHVELRLLKQPQCRERTKLEIAQGNLTARGFNFSKEAVCAASGSSAPCTRTRSV